MVHGRRPGFRASRVRIRRVRPQRGSRSVAEAMTAGSRGRGRSRRRRWEAPADECSHADRRGRADESPLKRWRWPRVRDPYGPGAGEVSHPRCFRNGATPLICACGARRAQSAESPTGRARASRARAARPRLSLDPLRPTPNRVRNVLVLAAGISLGRRVLSLAEQLGDELNRLLAPSGRQAL
jgi:hypothetical protein